MLRKSERRAASKSRSRPGSGTAAFCHRRSRSRASPLADSGRLEQLRSSAAITCRSISRTSDWCAPESRGPRQAGSVASFPKQLTSANASSRSDERGGELVIVRRAPGSASSAPARPRSRLATRKQAQARATRQPNCCHGPVSQACGSPVHVYEGKSALARNRLPTPSDV